MGSLQSSVFSLQSAGGRCRAGWRALGVVLLVAGLFAVPVEAQREVVPGKASTIGTAESEAVARAAFFQLRSPATPSHTLDMCPHGNAEALRDTIRFAAAEGQTVEQIVEGVIARHGDHMRIVPERRGAGLWAWVMPPFVLLAGAGLLTFGLRKLRGSGGRAEADPDPQLSDEDRRRLDEALAELEASQEEPA
jgi:cytochrome c-type biogenesis protein CcmH/NrfF